PGAIATGKPMRQINDNTRVEPCLRNPQEKSRAVELGCRSNEPDNDRAQAPADQDSRKPAPCTAAFHDEGTRYLELQIADNENSCSESIDGFRKMEVSRHRELRKRHVRSVQVGGQI